jgi:hypothetical protein
MNPRPLHIYTSFTQSRHHSSRRTYKALPWQNQRKQCCAHRRQTLVYSIPSINHLFFVKFWGRQASAVNKMLKRLQHWTMGQLKLRDRSGNRVDFCEKYDAAILNLKRWTQEKQGGFMIVKSISKGPSIKWWKKWQQWHPLRVRENGQQGSFDCGNTITCLLRKERGREKNGHLQAKKFGGRVWCCIRNLQGAWH